MTCPIHRSNRPELYFHNLQNLGSILCKYKFHKNFSRKKCQFWHFFAIISEWWKAGIFKIRFSKISTHSACDSYLGCGLKRDFKNHVKNTFGHFLSQIAHSAFVMNWPTYVYLSKWPDLVFCTMLSILQVVAFGCYIYSKLYTFAYLE